MKEIWYNNLLSNKLIIKLLIISGIMNKFDGLEDENFTISNDIYDY